jgi:RHS repeat-associated protein
MERPMHRFARALGALLIALSIFLPAQARFLSADPVPPDKQTGGNFNRYAYANNSPYVFVDPDGRIPLFIPILAGVSLVLATGESHAPAPGTHTSAMSPGDAASKFIDALPFGRATIPLRAAVESGSYTNTHASGKTYDGKGDRQRSQRSGQRVERQTGDTHVATDWSPASGSRDAFRQESQRLDSHGGPKSDTNYNQIESPGKRFREEDQEP